jgi:hypothetical protein
MNSEFLTNIEIFLNNAGLDQNDEIVLFSGTYCSFLVSDGNYNNFHVLELKYTKNIHLFINGESIVFDFTYDMGKIVEYYHIYKNLVHGVS